MKQIYVQFQVDNVEIELAIIKYTNIATQTQIPGQLQNTSIWGRIIIEHTHFGRMEPRETPKGESLWHGAYRLRDQSWIPSRTIDNLGTFLRREQRTKNVQILCGVGGTCRENNRTMFATFEQ